MVLSVIERLMRAFHVVYSHAAPLCSVPSGCPASKIIVSGRTLARTLARPLFTLSLSAIKNHRLDMAMVLSVTEGLMRSARIGFPANKIVVSGRTLTRLLCTLPFHKTKKARLLAGPLCFGGERGIRTLDRGISPILP